MAPENENQNSSILMEQELENENYPEGGLQAWLVVIGAWCAMVPPMGLLNNLSVLQAWYSEHELLGIPESKTGWVFSCYAFFITACGAQVGPIFDAHNIRALLLPGSVGLVTSMIFLSFSKEFYQILLSFGVCGGISASLLFNPALSAVGHWFCKRRALATGIACTAGGIGAIIFTLIFQYLAPRIGLPWAIRTIAFISAGLLILANIFLKKRLPPAPEAKLSIDFSLLRDPRFAISVTAIFFVEFAVFIPYSYISSYALHSKLDIQQSFLLNILLNAGAIPGRMLPGYIADRVGAFNTMCFTSLTCGVLIFSLWLTAGADRGKIMAYATLFGFWSGAAISLSPVCISRVCKIEDYGKSNGIAYFIASFGALIGIPIAGSLLGTGENSYRGLICFAGGAYMVAFAVFCIARGIAGGWKPRAF